MCIRKQENTILEFWHEVPIEIFSEHKCLFAKILLRFILYTSIRVEIVLYLTAGILKKKQYRQQNNMYADTFIFVFR